MADFDPFDEADAGLDHQLRTTLWKLAEHARYAELPAPAAEIRTRGDRRRHRRIAGTAALAVAAAVITVTVVTAGMTGVRLTTAPPAPPATAINLPAPTAGQATATATDLDLSVNPAHDAGYLIGAQSQNGQLVLTFDRVILFSGAAAIAANHGVAPPNDVLIVNNNPKLRTFVVKPGALLLGGPLLGVAAGDASPAHAVPITRQQLIERTLTVIGQDHKAPLVMLKHVGGAEGQVIGLQEVSLP